MNPFYTILLPSYETTLHVSINQSDEDLLKDLRKVMPLSRAKAMVASTGGSGQGYTWDDGEEVIVRFKTYRPGQIWLVAHEMFHATFRILDGIDTPLTSSTEEVYAYLLDYLIRSFYERT